MADVVFQIKSSQGVCVRGANVLAAYPDGRYLTGETDLHGECRLGLYRTDQNMKVLVAAEGHLPFHDTVVPGGSETVPLELTPSTKERKSALFTRSTGYIPGVDGASSIRIKMDTFTVKTSQSTDDSRDPAARFEIGEALHLIDVYGVETTIRVSGGRGPVFAYRIH